jgi:hypothetical protein
LVFPKRTKIDFEAPDNTIDYGKVKNTENGIRFYFTNTGNAPLIITNVLSTCGCTVPTKPNEPIMPGKLENKCKIQYGSRSY